jgi:hypothetical protein
MEIINRMETTNIMEIANNIFNKKSFTLIQLQL